MYLGKIILQNCAPEKAFARIARQRTVIEPSCLLVAHLAKLPRLDLLLRATLCNQEIRYKLLTLKRSKKTSSKLSVKVFF